MGHDLFRLSQARHLCRDGHGRSLRTQALISLNELSDALSVDPSTLSRWETGATVPRPAAAIRWLDTLQQLASQHDEPT